MNSEELQKLLDEYKKLNNLESYDVPLPPTIPSQVQAAPIPEEQPIIAPQTPMLPTASGYGQGLTDKDLQAAQQSQRNIQLIADLGRAGSTIGDAIASKGTSKPIVSDTSLFKDIAERSKQPIENILQRRKAKDDELTRQSKQYDLSNTKALQDPSSDISKALRSGAKLAGLPLPENVSGAQLQASGLNLGTLINAHQMAQARLESAKLSKEERESTRKVSNIGRYQQDFNKDKETQRATAGIDDASFAKGLIDSNNPIADEAIKERLARLSGQVGVLTEQDIQRFGGSKALDSRIKQATKQTIDGKLTDENRQFMRSLIDLFGQRNEQIRKKRAEHYAKQAAKRFSMDEDEAFDYLLPGQERPIKDEEIPPHGPVVIQNGHTYTWNPQTKKYE